MPAQPRHHSHAGRTSAVVRATQPVTFPPPLPQDKEAKTSYLTKLLDAISGALGQPVPARPSRIIAGLEPEATNAMLQMLAAAATGGGGGKGACAPGSAARRYAPPAGAGRGSSTDDEAGQEAEEPEVVFARADGLLPALSRRCADARAALATGAAPGSREALALCDQVAAIAADAVVLARCLEGLQGAGPVIAAESAAWRKEADKLAARLEAEQQAEAQAAAVSRQRMVGLEAQLAAARQRLAVAAGRR